MPDQRTAGTATQGIAVQTGFAISRTGAATQGIKVLDSLWAAVVSDFRNHIFALLCAFSILSMSRLQCLTRIALHVRDVGELGIYIIGGSVLCFYNVPQYSVGSFAAFLCLFLPLVVFGDDDT